MSEKLPMDQCDQALAGPDSLCDALRGGEVLGPVVSVTSSFRETGVPAGCRMTAVPAGCRMTGVPAGCRMTQIGSRVELERGIRVVVVTQYCSQITSVPQLVTKINRTLRPGLWVGAVCVALGQTDPAF